MQTENIFIPRQQQVNSRPKPDVPVVDSAQSTNPLNSFIQIFGQGLMVLLVGTLPLFFLPESSSLFGLNKVMFALGFAFLILLVQTVLMTRTASVKVVVPLSLMLFGVFVVVAFTSAIMSGDAHDAIFGNAFEVHTAMFMAVMLLAMFTPLILQGSKQMMLRLMTLFGLASTLVLLHAGLRIFLGAEFLSFNSFESVTQTVVGGFNDLAIFAGLAIVLGIMTLLLLPLRRFLQLVVVALIALALSVQIVVDFTHVWSVLIFVSLLVILYTASQKRFIVAGDKDTIARPSIVGIVSVIVLLVSLFFLFAGDGVTKQINDKTGTNYIEVRPSLTSTIGIISATYQDQSWLGVGPNRFSDAWRLYKDPSINRTIFWDTDFSGGYAYVPTIFVTLGLVGGGLLVLFHVCYVYFGIRMLTRSVKQDMFWHSIALIAFVASMYLWILSYLFVPSATLLILAALFSGVVFATASSLMPDKVAHLSLNTDKQRGVVLLGTGLLTTIAIVIVSFVIFDQYSATKYIVSGEITSERAVTDDRYYNAMAGKAFATMQNAAISTQPSEENQQIFFDASKEALKNAELAIGLDKTNPANHVSLAEIYANLAAAGVAGALTNAENALEEAKRYDPVNPKYTHAAAELALRLGDRERAKVLIADALTLKQNYTEAMVLQIQVDIAEGNVAEAIETTKSVIRLEPNNPTRYFQLGVLLTSEELSEEAEEAYRQAIAIDPLYANARYLLALLLIEKGEVNEALKELYLVRQTNTNNQQLSALITQLESGETVENIDELANIAVRRARPNVDSSTEAVTVPTQTESDLVVPVNQEFSPEELLNQ